MLKDITFNEVIITIRQLLIDSLKIDGNRVLNSLSVRGADLLKIINDTELNSFNLSDSFIVFELKEDNNKEYYVLEENDKFNTVAYSMQMDLKIYGKPCAVIAKKISSMFQEDDILYTLYDKGIYFRGSTAPTSVNEFINKTMWPRRDITLNLDVRENVEKVNPNDYFDEKDMEYISSVITTKKF